MSSNKKKVIHYTVHFSFVSGQLRIPTISSCLNCQSIHSSIPLTAVLPLFSFLHPSTPTMIPSISSNISEFITSHTAIIFFTVKYHHCHHHCHCCHHVPRHCLPRWHQLTTALMASHIKSHFTDDVTAHYAIL